MWLHSLKEAVASADIVITMLEAGPIVKRVVQDMLPSLKASALVIDMSCHQTVGGERGSRITGLTTNRLS